jgi:hypothetical protein
VEERVGGKRAADFGAFDCTSQERAAHGHEEYGVQSTVEKGVRQCPERQILSWKYCGEVDCSLLVISKCCVWTITVASHPFLLLSFPLDACLLCTEISK